MSERPSVFDQISQMTEARARAGDTTFYLPASVVTHFERGGVKSDEINSIIGPADELFHLAKTHRPLTQEQTDRASRLARIVNLAERVFGAREKAFFWLRLKNTFLGNKTPLECLVRESGARIVEDALLRIEYGNYS
jgi:putative toxin-antitoxin system antitoxin component (TIGR02293 family)